MRYVSKNLPDQVCQLDVVLLYKTNPQNSEPEKVHSVKSALATYCLYAITAKTFLPSIFSTESDSTKIFFLTGLFLFLTNQQKGKQRHHCLISFFLWMMIAL